MVKALVLCVAAWAAPLIASFISTGIIAASTSSLGASAVGPWMLLAIALQVLFFGGASVVLYRLLGPLLQGSSRLGLFLAHSVVQLGLTGVMAFGTLVAFNR